MQYLITGAGRPNGIGAEFVRQLLAAGHTVHATVRDPSSASHLKDTRLHALDVKDERSIAALAKDIRELDVLINNAGLYQDDALSMATLTESFAVNAAGPLLVTQALLPALERGTRKLAVHITSRMGSIADNTSGGAYAYRMSKAALNMASKSLAVDLAPRGITSVVLHPGWVKTDMGGRGATLTAEGSVRGMLSLIERLTQKDSGRFYNFKGEEIPF